MIDLFEKEFDGNIVKMPFICPYCKNEYTIDTHIRINIPGDELLKQQILDKKMYYTTCPKCHKESKLKSGCVYLDLTKQVMIILTETDNPLYSEFLTVDNITKNDIKSDQDLFKYSLGMLRRRIVYDVDTLREKILLSEWNYDDRIVELMKLTLSKMIEKNEHKPVYRIFVDEITKHEMKFIAYLGMRPPFHEIETMAPLLIYNDFNRKYKKKLGRAQEDQYIYTNQSWAAKSGLVKGGDSGILLPT